MTTQSISYLEIFSILEILSDDFLKKDKQKYSLKNGSTVPFVALYNVTSYLDDLKNGAESDEYVITKIEDFLKFNQERPFKIWSKMKKNAKFFINAFSKFENEFLIVAMKNYEICTSNLLRLTTLYEEIKNKRDEAFMITFNSIYVNILDVEDGDDITITNDTNVWQNGKVISQIGRLFGAIVVNFSAVSFRLKILIKQLSLPDCPVYLVEAKDWTSLDTKRNRSAKDEFENLCKNILFAVHGFNDELIQEMLNSVQNIEDIAKEQLEIVKRIVTQGGNINEYEIMIQILEEIGTIAEKDTMLGKCHNGILLYAKIIAHKMCFIEAIAEHNFMRLKMTNVEPYSMLSVTVYEDDEKIYDLEDAWTFFTNYKRLFLDNVAKKNKIYNEYLQYQKTVIFPTFLENVDSDLSLWNSLNVPNDHTHFSILSNMQYGKQANMVVSYRSLIDYQVIMSLAFATCIGPNVMRQGWDVSNNSDPRLLILSPTGTGKSDIYYQTVANIQKYDTSGSVYVLVKRSTIREQFFGMKTCPILLSSLTQDKLSKVSDAEYRQAISKLLDDDIDVKQYKNLDEAIENMTDADKKDKAQVQKNTTPKKINFVSTINPYFVESKYSQITGKIVLKEMIEKPSILIIDEVDDLIEQGTKYEKKKLELSKQELEALEKNAINALETFEKAEAVYMKNLQDFYIVRMKCAYKPDFYLENQENDDKAFAEKIIAQLTPPGKNISDTVDKELLDKYALRIPNLRPRNMNQVKDNKDNEKIAAQMQDFEAKLKKIANIDLKKSEPVPKTSTNVGANFSKQLQSFGILTEDKTLDLTDKKVQEQVVADYQTKLEKDLIALGELQNEADRLEFYLVGKTYISLKSYIEGENPEKCQGLVGLTATYGSVDVMQEMFTLFRRVSDDKKITNFKECKEDIAKSIEQFTIKQNSDYFNKVVNSCGFKTYDYKDMIEASKMFEENKPRISSLMDLISYVAMYKPNDMNDNQRDDAFGRMFPVIEMFKEPSFQQQELKRVKGKYFSHPVMVEVSIDNLKESSQEMTQEENVVKLFQIFANDAAKKIDSIVQNSKLDLNGFPNKVLIIVKGRSAKSSLVQALRNISNGSSYLVVNTDSSDFEQDFDLFQNDDNEIDNKVLVATYKDGGRGVDYKNVRVLIKIGFFNYAENTQINGRINRIHSIAHPSLQNVTEEERNLANQVKMYFIVPTFNSRSKLLTNDYWRKKEDQLNCYIESYKMLMTQQRYYNEFMMFLSKKSFISSAVQERMLMNKNITYELQMT